MSRYDVLYYSNISLIKKIKPTNKNIFSSITSHKFCINELVTIAHKCVKCSVNNNFLFLELNKILNNISYIPNGVDTKRFWFKEKKLSNPIRLGWVGNIDRKCKNYTIFDNLRKALHRKFVFIDVKTKKNTGKEKNIDEMIDFYHTIDFLLVTSSSEGTPNPALESMSCGTPVISTYVGNMPEIIVNGVNGHFVKCDINSFLDFFSKEHFFEYEKIQYNSRKAIESWDWDNRIELWKNFFTGNLNV